METDPGFAAGPEGTADPRGRDEEVNDKNEGFHCSEVTARAFFRTINVPEHEVLGYDSVDAKGAVKDHPTALKDAYEAGKALVR